ncbi:acetylornithine deacetylase [Acidovorax sp. 99]|uniref:Acetylornithine deacetylase n=1 Tax=Acidovorax delafieldii TaxID=47920 RepID=A0AAJ2BSV0_ACIDE|nr:MULTISPECIES: acetylornithine deacetylase [Acidovorax]MDR6155347.1 acetylornithine deacetylase [Acidovorax delafieldii]MDR6765530.1 acetylornithine deacetylase [Acidovorax delafieldii]MDR6835968.1 acetylornithine deacetylase [Acidovorax delafieldii]MDR7365062.1 acetylornithine deacetylase [Acidovorax delafieldii]PVY91544.1 acetylornithine deacetylase [Acidovorax sp. 99]
MISAHALELAQTLVRMNTVSHNSNLELIHFIRDHLARLGVKSRLTFNEDKTKANLFATLGEGKPAGIILSGHTDTVPWDGQDWTMDPLSALVKDGNLYGRGSADMKAFIGVAVSQAEQFLNSDAPFALHYAFSYEEEIGCFGVKELIADLRDANIQPLACIVGEPTSMIPAIAHKGVYRYKCCVRGKEAHSSLTPHSVNAIEMAARVVGRVRDMAEDFEKNEPRFEGFDVPFSTSSVGQFHGGIADNVVPRDAEFRYEFRDLPTANAAQMQSEVVAYAKSLEPAMKKVAPAAGFEFETICEIPSFLGSKDDPVTRLAQELSGEKSTTLVAFGTEAGLFKNAGISTVVCGPGSIQQAHQPDEYVSLEQLGRCEAFMQGLARTKSFG